MSLFTSSKRPDFMPDESRNAADVRGTGSTVIASGVRVEGDFASQGDVVIEGEVHGKVTISGKLTVGPQARLKADVTADQATIAGSVEGNLSVRSHLDLKATAKIMGDLTCETVAIESGASLNGKVTVGSAVSQKPAGKSSGSKETER